MRLPPVAVDDVPRRGRARCVRSRGCRCPRRFTAAGAWTDPKQNCTHQFDAACHAITHAARGGRDADSTTSRSRAATSTTGGRTRCVSGSTASCALSWSLTWDGIVDPAAAVRRRAVARRVHALGRRDACPRTTPSARSRCAASPTSAWVAAWISTACPSRRNSRPSMGGVCYTMQPGIVEVAFRNAGRSATSPPTRSVCSPTEPDGPTRSANFTVPTGSPGHPRS